jgi:hypothetical protein
MSSPHLFGIVAVSQGYKISSTVPRPLGSGKEGISREIEPTIVRDKRKIQYELVKAGKEIDQCLAKF